MQARRLRLATRVLVLLAALLGACDPLDARLPPVAQEPTATALPTAAPPTVTPIAPTVTPTPLPTATPWPTATATPPPTATPLTPEPTLPMPTADERARMFEQIWSLVRDRYIYTDYRGVDWQAARQTYEPRAAGAATPEEFYQALREMIALLGDDHSRFESPRETAEEEARSSGQWRYGGIGVNIREHSEGGLITRLAPGGPAETAGLRPRDLILAVGGVVFTDTAAFGPGGPSAAVRGAPGTAVELTVRSPGAPPREVVVTRQLIDDDAFPPILAQRLPGSQVGLLTIDTFDRADLAERIRAQVEVLLDGGPLEGLIVDVRDNGGGFIDTLLHTLALFVDGGSIGTSSSRDTRDQVRIPGGETIARLDRTPIVVLTSAETASAAEMFAAALQLSGRARVVGTPSAGNTENLLEHNFPDGSRLWLAEFAYRLPDGTSLEGRGVLPNRVVEAEWWRFDPADDPQLKAAIEELRAADSVDARG